MSDDSVMYDTPLEFVASAIQRQDECAAQSVIPRDDGTYACGCSCKGWEATAPSLEEGLRLAREHTARPHLNVGQTQINHLISYLYRPNRVRLRKTAVRRGVVARDEVAL